MFRGSTYINSENPARCLAIDVDLPDLRGATDQLTHLKQQIQHHLKRDQRQSFDNEARLIKDTMMNNDISAKNGFQLLQKWYKQQCSVKLPMSHSKLEMVATSYEEPKKQKTANALDVCLHSRHQQHNILR
jgi:hypothetical protein